VPYSIHLKTAGHHNHDHESFCFLVKAAVFSHSTLSPIFVRNVLINFHMKMSSKQVSNI